MKNILATHSLPWRLGVTPTGVIMVLSLIGSTVWCAWATNKLLLLEKREVVTVQLSRVMGDFVETEARSGRPPEEMRLRVQAYLKAVDASVRHLSRDGRTVLVAEAVVGSSALDLTEVVRGDVAKRMGALSRAPR